MPLEKRPSIELISIHSHFLIVKHHRPFPHREKESRIVWPYGNSRVIERGFFIEEETGTRVEFARKSKRFVRALLAANSWNQCCRSHRDRSTLSYRATPLVDNSIDDLIRRNAGGRSLRNRITRFADLVRTRWILLSSRRENAMTYLVETREGCCLRRWDRRLGAVKMTVFGIERRTIGLFSSVQNAG